MNLKLAKQIADHFPSYLSYGVTKNTNSKYLKQGYRTLIVAVFPYYCVGENELFSKYCTVYDYHKVVKDEFEKIFAPLGIEYLSFADISPFGEKKLAEDLGLGEIGEHNLLLTEEYGSFVFLGEVLLKEELPEKTGNFPKLCTHCGNCKKACPTNALEEGFERGKCLSHLSQKKQLTDEEEALYVKSKLAWGCDVCQLACPVNQSVGKTPIDAFKQASLTLTKEEILALSEEEFQEKYQDYAFAYKGIEILRRNVRLQDEYKMESIKKENI
ncbi:MAG: epoxyqueuosine reductase [Ruminococcaceae bacterium]|nr:epoxyqueuosine reductase [Oscillospiraceae bacterium]